MSAMTITPSVATIRTPQVRLTRRGRLVVFIAALLVVLAGAIFLGTSSMASNESGAAQETEVIMVGYGETLWDISADLAGEGSVRDMMRTIKDLNALDSSMLVAGQELFVPVAD